MELGPLNIKKLLQDRLLTTDKLQNASIVYNDDPIVENREEYLQCGYIQDHLERKKSEGIVRRIFNGFGIVEGLQLENSNDCYWQRIIWWDGSYFTGWFKKFKRHGYGKSVNISSRIVEGLWDQDKYKAKYYLVTYDTNQIMAKRFNDKDYYIDKSDHTY